MHLFTTVSDKKDMALQIPGGGLLYPLPGYY